MSEQRYLRLLEAMCNETSAALCVIDQRQRCTYANPALSALTGYTAEELGERPLPVLLQPTAADEFAAALAAQRRVSGAGGFRHKTGAGLELAYVGNPLIDGGEWLGSVLELRDIGPDQRRDEALSRRSQQLQLLAATAADIARAGTLQSVLDEITEAARRIVGAHQAVVSLTRGENWSQAINAVALTEKYAGWRDYSAMPDGSGIYAMVCEQNRPLRLTQAELEAHPRWRGFGRYADRHPPLRGWLGAPLTGRDGRNLGLIQLSDKEDGSDFDATDEALLVQLAQLAAAAIEQSVAEQALRRAADADALRVELGDVLRPLADPVAIQREAARVLGQYLKVGRVVYGEMSADGEYVTASADYCDGLASLAGRHRVRDYGPTLLQEFMAGRTLVVADVATDPRLGPAEREATLRLKVVAEIVVPLIKEGRLIGMFVVHHVEPRAWSEQDVALTEETADRTWAALERAQTEAALRAAHRHTSNILESIDDCCYALDARRRFTYVNARAEAYFGLPKERMLGRDYAEVFPATRGHEVLRRQDEAMSQARTVRFETLSPVTGRWVELNLFPADGGLTVYFRDVTERVAARARHAALLELGDRLRPLAEPEQIAAQAAAIIGRTLGGIRAGYGIVDATEQWFDVSEDWTAAASSSAGRWRLADFWTGFSAALRRGETVVIEDVAADERLTAAAVHAYLAEGVQAFVNVPIIAEGRVAAILYIQFSRPRLLSEAEHAFVRDVTDRTWAAVERARADAALRASDRRKDEFLAMLAHELRTPLASLSVASELLDRSGLDPQRARRMREISRRQIKHLGRLVDDLLDVSRITRGVIELRPERVDLRTVVERALESVQEQVEEKQHTVKIELPTSALPVMGDPARLEQILTNLLVNSAKYTPAQGRIEVGLQRRGDSAELSVRDNGVGIEPQLLERVFDLFGQAERSLARSEGGLGIGLTIVKNLVELHGGQVMVRSEGRGRGAEFTVILPLLVAELQAAEQESAAPGRLGREKTVLVVDDNVDAAETLAMLLEDYGHRVLVAHDAAGALAKAARERPQLALLDIGLPGMDGYELARRLRDDPRTASMTLAAVTGYGQPGDRERTQEAGFDAHFVKPVDIDALEAFVNGVEPQR